MKRDLFLTGLAAVAWSAATPRVASAFPATARVRILRHARAQRAPVPGGCADRRSKPRWSSLTAADFV
jgi:hypothetical protein